MESRKFYQSVIILPLTLLAGCAGFHDFHYESTQKARAIKQYVECGKPSCEKFPKDYKLGWLDGFYNIATGGPECPPAVAPRRYWDPKTVLNDCDQRRHAYYSGWQDGASRASQFPDTHHLKIFETCECPMPRCHSACGTGDCLPCGLGSVGTPVYEELIETPQHSEMVIPEPAAPTPSHQSSRPPEPPTVTKSTVTKSMVTKSTGTKLSGTEAAAIKPATLVGPQHQFSAAPATPRSQDGSAVRLQELDPVELDSPEQVVNGSKQQLLSLATQTLDPIDAILASTVQQRSDAIPRKGSRRNGTSKGRNQTFSPAGRVRLVETDAFPKMIEVQPEASSVPSATKHPAIVAETQPVRFEMIESGNAGIARAK